MDSKDNRNHKLYHIMVKYDLIKIVFKTAGLINISEKISSATKGWCGHIAVIGLICAAGLFGMKDLLGPDLFSAHDIWHQVARLYHYSEAFKAGMFLPNWIFPIAEGIGYPLFYFSYHLPWILSAPFVAAGFSIEFILKGLFIKSFIGAGLAMYLLVFRISRDKMAAFLAAIAYMWAPYQFFAVMVAGAVGTSLSLALLPLLFLGFWMILSEKSVLGVVLTGVAAAGIMLSHLITFVMILPFISLFGLVLLAKNRGKDLKLHILYLLGSAVLAGLLAGFYLLPMLSYLPEIGSRAAGNGYSELFERYFVNFKQLVYSPWGYGPVTTNAKDGELSFQVGIVQWLGIGLLGLAVIFRRTHEHKWLSLGVLCLFGLSIIGMLDISAPVWRLANELATVDFPFRLLMLSVFFGSLALGLVMTTTRKLEVRVFFLIMAFAAAWYTNRNHVRVNMRLNFPLEAIVRAEKTTNTFAEYLPKDASSELLDDQDFPLVFPEQILVGEYKVDYSGIEFMALAEDIAQVTVKQFDFPGQTVYIDNIKVAHTASKDGLIAFELEPGEHNIKISHQATLSVILGRLASMVGLTAAALIFINQKRKT